MASFVIAKPFGFASLHRPAQIIKARLSLEPHGNPTKVSATPSAISQVARLANASAPGAFLQVVCDKLQRFGGVILQLLAALLKRGHHECKGVWFKFEHLKNGFFKIVVSTTIEKRPSPPPGSDGSLLRITQIPVQKGQG
jgi:hypothetical protein